MGWFVPLGRTTLQSRRSRALMVFEAGGAWVFGWLFSGVFLLTLVSIE